MGPKKKSKASKFARMTEEEKARYLQHRAAIEEEARRRKQELVFTFLKSKFKREEAFARINLAKINQQWRQILRNVKIEEMKKDLEAQAESFQRLISKKDQTIQNLLYSLQEADIQYGRNLHSHICATDRLIELQDERLKVLHEAYHTSKTAMLRERDMTIKKCNADINTAQEKMHLIIYASETKFFKAESEERAEYITRSNELKNLMEHEHNLVKTKIKVTTEGLWQIYQNTIQDYLSSTEERRKQYTILKAKDDHSSFIIEKQAKKIEDFEKLSEKLKENLMCLQGDYNKTVNGLKEERQEYASHLYQLKSKSAKSEKLDKEQLTFMTSVSNDAINKLENLILKAESILKLAQSCSRFETLEEKVIRPDKAAPIDAQEELVRLTSQLNLSDFNELDGFWARYNKVLMECATLKLHSSALTIENEQLKAALKHYFNSISPSSCLLGNGGDKKQSAKDMKQSSGITLGIFEASRKKFFPRKDLNEKLQRPVTSIEGAIALRTSQLKS